MPRLTKKLRTGLLGCGHAAQYLHLPVLTRTSNIELAAVAEENEDALAHAAARSPQAKTYRDYRKLLDEAGVEAVVIALPNPLHVPAATAAFERGLHVYLEKPLGLGLGQGRDVLRAWRASKRVGMIGYNYRYGSMQQEARRLIAEGRIGQVVAMQSVFSSAPRELPEWKRTRATGGGALVDLASHHLDLVPWLTGAAPVAISCTLQSSQSEDDTAALQLELESGTVAQILASIGGVENDRLEIMGDAGRIVADRYRSDDLELHPASLARVRALRASHAIKALASPQYWRRKFTDAGPEASYWRALAAFAEAALQGRPASPDLLDGYRGLILVEAAMRSASEGQKVSISAKNDENLTG